MRFKNIFRDNLYSRVRLRGRRNVHSYCTVKNKEPIFSVYGLE